MWQPWQSGPLLVLLFISRDSLAFLSSLKHSNYHAPFRKSRTEVSFAECSPPSSSPSSASYSYSSACDSNDRDKKKKIVTVSDMNMECVTVTVELPRVGPVTVLEATAQSQDKLVHLALLEGEVEGREGGQEDQLLQLCKGDIYGSVLWPAAFATASYLLSQNLITNKTSVLELGAGTGLVSLACSLGGAYRVLVTDYEEIPLALLRYAAAHLNHHQQQPNPKQQQQPLAIETRLFDICSSEPLPLPTMHEEDDEENDATTVMSSSMDVVVVAADVMYEPATGRALARRVWEALLKGCRVVVGDSPGRAGRPAFLQELSKLFKNYKSNAGTKNLDDDELNLLFSFRDWPGWTVTGDRNELICGKESASKSSSTTPQELMIAILDLDPKAIFYQSSKT